MTEEDPREEFREIEDEEESEITEEETIEEEQESEEETKIGYCTDHGMVKAVFKGKRWRCPECGRIVSTRKPSDRGEVGGRRRRKKQTDETDEEEGYDYEIEEFEVEDEYTKEAIEYLKRNLPRVPGISRPALKKIIETLEFDPNILRNPTLLHMHIKSLAKQANVYYLSMVINRMFMKLQPLLEEPEMVYYPYQHMQHNMPAMPPGPLPVTPGIPPGMPGMSAMTPVPAQEKRKKRKVYRIVVDGQVIETDDPQEFLEIKRWLKEQEKAELEKKKLEEEIKKIARERADEEKKSKSTDDEQIRSLMSRIDSLQRQLAQVYEEKRKLESKLEEFVELQKKREYEELKRKVAEVEELKKNPWKLLKEAEEQLATVGFTRTNRSILDIIDDAAKNVHMTVNNLINRLPGPKRNPEKYSEEERKKRLETVKNMVKETEDYIESENNLIKAAQKIYS